jgi:hypothetical protein
MEGFCEHGEDSQIQTPEIILGVTKIRMYGKESGCGCVTKY